MITVTDFCEIGKISINSIEGGSRENKIITVPHCIGDKMLKILVKLEIFPYRCMGINAWWQEAKPWYQVTLAH